MAKKRKARTFVLGDLHGNIKALKQVLKTSSFKYNKDELIVLGDVCDGWAYVDKCIDELLKIKNLKFIMGNHDKWALEWALTGKWNEGWTMQGGMNTIRSYYRDGKSANLMPKSHVEFLSQALPYYEKGNLLFVHGGIKAWTKASENDLETLIWDRDLVEGSLRGYTPLTHYDMVYVGHTPTNSYGIYEPISCNGITMMDTGAGWGKGRLSMMNIDSKVIYQSSQGQELYPNEKGR